jgi:hypothetical protein
MNWVGHVACMGKKRNAHTILARGPHGRRQLRKLYIDERIILRQILKK